MKDLDLKMEEVETMSKNELKKMLKKKIDEAAMKYLNNVKQNQSKGRVLTYKTLNMQQYLKSESNLSVLEMCQIFQIRSQNLPVKANFSHQYKDTNCVVEKCNGEDSQEGLFYCNFLAPKNMIVRNQVEYEGIYSDDLNQQLEVARIVYQKFKSREKYLTSLNVKRTPGDQEEETLPLGSRVEAQT